jgi:hypothetical protein
LWWHTKVLAPEIDKKKRALGIIISIQYYTGCPFQRDNSKDITYTY